MAGKDVRMHLNADRIQAFLDGSLGGEERVGVEEHATFCARCQAELEAWQLLFSELGELPELRPSEGFALRVLAGVERPVVLDPEVSGASDPAKAGRFGWLGPRAATAARHVGPERLQDYVGRLLPARQMARVAAHLDACGACRTEAAAWSELVRRIEALPELAPSAGFRQQVMAQVRIRRPAPERATAGGRAGALAWARRLVPPTQRAWAALSGVAVTPITVAALLAYAVFSNPAVTPGYLASFLWWQVSAGLSAVAGLLADALLESAFVFQGYSVFKALAGAPGAAAMVAVSLAGATSLCGWVLYRNLVLTQAVDGQHARVSI